MRFSLEEVLEGKRRVALGGHIHPDGDCVGSTLGLYLYLKKAFPALETVLYLEEIPACFHFLKGAEEIRHRAEGREDFDLFIALDAADKDRLGFSQEVFDRAKETCCIDHHISNPGFADHNLVLPEASSTSELVYGLLDPRQVDRDIAAPLYIGIAHDTGVFLYQSTTPQTLETAAALLRTGIPATELLERTYYEKTLVQQKILGRALLDGRLFFGERCITALLTREAMEQYGASPQDVEGIVSQLRNTVGVEVAIFLYELDPGVFKVSLRSKSQVDVRSIAQSLGGGGHMRAAGVTLEGTEEEILKMLLSKLRPALLSEEEEG